VTDTRKFVLRPGHIFVFGSNLAGIHGAGAANTAFRLYGAIRGRGQGLMGHSYALPTKDKNMRPLALDVIDAFVMTFIETARHNPSLSFFVTRVGCGLAGYKDEQIAPMFASAPSNCDLPPGWRS